MSDILGIGIEREISKFQRMLDRFLTFVGIRQQSIANLSEPLWQFGEHIIRTHIPLQLNVQGTPRKFAALSPRYARRKAVVAPGMPILMRSGQMATSYRYDLNGNLLVINNSRPFAPYHQTGTTKMPAREVIQLQEDENGYDVLHRAVADHIENSPAPVGLVVYE